MRIFNSLGSNYNASFVFWSLLLRPGSKSQEQLKQFLEKKYKGKVTLLYKGREGLELALRALNYPQGSKVVINGFTCYAVYKAISNAGYSIEYLDIDKDSLNFTTGSLKEKLDKDPSIKVVVIQNTLGYPCDIVGISNLCKRNKIVLIEDLAHSIGTLYENGAEAGSVGDFTVLSFSQDKMIDGISGGALIVRNAKYSDVNFDKLIDISWKAKLTDIFYPIFTLVIRLTYGLFIGKLIHIILKKLNLLSKPMGDGQDGAFHLLPNHHAALAYLQFQALDENLNHRRQISTIYNKLISTSVTIPEISRYISKSTNLRFPIRVMNRDGLVNYLKVCGIYISDIWYDSPIAPKKYLGLTDYKGQCPNSEKTSSEILNLPTHLNVSDLDAKRISNHVNIWLKSKQK